MFVVGDNRLGCSWSGSTKARQPGSPGRTSRSPAARDG